MPQQRPAFSWLLIAVKGSKIIAVLKSVQVFKILLSLASMLLSVIVYGLTLGIWFGVGLVGMLFIHEMGHVIALRQKHLPASLPVFIPFLGAAIFAPNMGDRATEAYVGYGGPFVGSIAALACFGLWAALGGTSDLLLVISYIGVYINLFNLIPISPLDGGRITQAIGVWFKYIGAVLAILLVIESNEPGMIFLLIIMLEAFEFSMFGRSLVAICLWLTMLVLFAAGYNSQVFLIDFVDAMIGGLITALYVARDMSRANAVLETHEGLRLVQINVAADLHMPMEQASLTPIQRGWFQRMRFAYTHQSDRSARTQERAMPPVKTRIFWLAAYLGLALVLGVTIATQNAYLPVHMQPQPERHSVG
jgi:Zn-dependent protease